MQATATVGSFEITGSYVGYISTIAPTFPKCMTAVVFFVRPSDNIQAAYPLSGVVKSSVLHKNDPFSFTYESGIIGAKGRGLLEPVLLST